MVVLNSLLTTPPLSDLVIVLQLESFFLMYFF